MNIRVLSFPESSGRFQLTVRYYRYMVHLKAARGNIEPEEVQARRSEKRRSPTGSISAASNDIAINAAYCMCQRVLVLRCGQVTDTGTEA